MKHLLPLVLATVAISTTAFGSESSLLNKLANNYGDGVEAILVGKNLINNKACYFKLHLGGSYNLMSVDSSGIFRSEGVNTYAGSTVRANSTNNVEIFNKDVTPSFLGRTAEAKIKSTGSTLKVEIRNDVKLECAFDLEENKDLPAVPQNCVDEEIQKTVADCHFTENVGNADQQVTSGKLELQKVTSKICVPGGVFESFAGYITQNGQVSYIAKKTGLEYGWHDVTLKDFGRKQNDVNSFSYSTKSTEYTYSKISKELVFKHEYKAGLFDTRKVAAKFKCQ